MGTTLEKIVWIPKGNEYELIHIENILFCQSNNYSTLFHIYGETKNLKQVLSTKGIGEWEKELEAYGFYRIHSQTLVNIKHIKKFINRKDGVVVLTNEIHLAVSKSRKQQFMEYTGIK
ncbi:LytTR family DNA-binding domain-containing protein [Emticicia sp. BO119]|uniref:LytR/AlgR family response regulator transcription factor n=1 Tax=Emticicia sp. BO119 TaxID=2757768 RepID=UPI0015F0F703|nr:LytTR family DNA-binding domain-containing protein [Emticicia sp. BO119]MBA4850511.1 LytTR family transcriptional regulator [Emticicia sp. BO119]